MHKNLLNSAPFVSVFLILTLVALCSGMRSTGLAVKVVLPQQREFGICDQRPIILDVLANNDVKVNADSVPLGQLGRRLDHVLLTRAERVVWIRGEGGASFGQVAQAIATAHEHADLIVLLTPFVDLNSCLPVSAPRSITAVIRQQC